jgi:copper chaperone
MRFKVENMHCGGCAKGVAATVKEADPSAEVQVHLDAKEIVVNGGRAERETLRNALQAGGWKVSPAG